MKRETEETEMGREKQNKEKEERVSQVKVKATETARGKG